MKEIIRKIIDLMSIPWLGTLIGIFGIFIAIFFYLRSRKISRLAYQHDTTSIIGSADARFPNELEIYFDGKAVPRVTLERIVLWNAGNTTLRGSQIVKTDPLRFELRNSNASILKVNVLKHSREVNACSVTRRKDNQRIADINFDFLDPGDGIAIEIIHSGSSEDLEIRGTLIGMPNGIKDYGKLNVKQQFVKKLPYPYIRIASKLGLSVNSFIAIYTLIAGLVLIFLGIYFITNDEKVTYLFIFGGAVYILVSFVFLWLSRKEPPKSLDISTLDMSNSAT